MVLVDPSVDKTTRLKPKQGSFTPPVNVSNDLKKMAMFYIDHTEVTVKQYKKTKPAKTKTLEFGMKLLSSAPTWVSDSVLMLYLNKIRHNR